MKRKNPPGGVIFDLDGTLLDTEPLYTQATTELVAQYGKEYDWNLKAKTMGSDARTGAALVIETLGLPLTVEEYSQRRVAALRPLFQNPPAIPGAKALVAQIRQHAPVAIGTSSYRELCELKWANHAWLLAFETVVCGDDVAQRKPAPDIFLAAAEALAVDPSDCLVFEDSPAGVSAARNAGMQVVALRTPELSRDLLAHATTVVDTYAELDLAALGFTR